MFCDKGWLVLGGCHNSFQGSSPIWSLCEADGALVTGGESGAVVRTAFGKKEAVAVDTTLEEAR